MTGAARIVVTLSVFGAMLALVVVRPRRWNEAWWTALAAATMLVLGLVSPREAIDATLAGQSALLFLLALLTLSLLVGKSGFFDWAAVHCARVAKGNARSLYRNSFVLGALVTATLSLDTTAVMLTPVMLALVTRLKLPAAPYVVMCAFVANVGSLALPISNLTNIVFADTFHLTFAVYASRMMAPQLIALLTTYAILRWHFRRELPTSFEGRSLPVPASVVPHRGYFVSCVTVLAVVLLGYFLAPLVKVEAYTIAFAGSGVLVVAGLTTRRVSFRAASELSWGLFPFVVGLFVAVRGLQNLGIVGAASTWLLRMRHGSIEAHLAAAGATALASNVMNNLPAALLARSVLVSSDAHQGTVLAALVGTDVGATLTPFGSLATMLVLTLAGRAGQPVSPRRLVVLALWATPVIVVATTLTLTLSLSLARAR